VSDLGRVSSGGVVDRLRAGKTWIPGGIPSRMKRVSSFATDRTFIDDQQTFC
jgi:hypothetical protein